MYKILHLASGTYVKAYYNIDFINEKEYLQRNYINNTICIFIKSHYLCEEYIYFTFMIRQNVEPIIPKHELEIVEVEDE